MFYRLKGGMLIDIRFDYNAPVTTKAYAVGNKVGTDSDNKIIVEGRNFGCRDYKKKTYGTPRITTHFGKL